MVRKVSLLIAGALLGATAMGAVQSLSLPAEAASSQTYKELSIFGDVFERVREQYVTKPNEKKLIEAAINGMLASLDPHSSYMDPQEAQDMRTQTRGEFGGLGIEVTMEDNKIKVITPIDDTPASRGGVLAGDLITAINGDAVSGMTLQDAVEKMRGPVDTKVDLTIERKGVKEPVHISLKRAIISVKAVKYRVDGDVGYLRIISFTEKTYDDLKNAIAQIQKKIGKDKVKGYVIDLRLNPGGLLDQAVDVSDAFLNGGEIVSTRGRNPDETRRFNARPGDLTDGKPIIVLINGGTASAAEIVSGALQDHHRATILGTRSFGKGSVQTIIPLGNDNGALRLTTALYYTPSGKSIQGTGIVPDIKVAEPIPADLKGKIIAPAETELKGHIHGIDETKKGSGSFAYVPPDPKKDVQLNEALDLINGKITNPAFPPKPEDQASAKK